MTTEDLDSAMERVTTKAFYSKDFGRVYEVTLGTRLLGAVRRATLVDKKGGPVKIDGIVIQPRWGRTRIVPMYSVDISAGTRHLVKMYLD